MRRGGLRFPGQGEGGRETKRSVSRVEDPLGCILRRLPQGGSTLENAIVRLGERERRSCCLFRSFPYYCGAHIFISFFGGSWLPLRKTFLVILGLLLLWFCSPLTGYPLFAVPDPPMLGRVTSIAFPSF